ncbi:MAG: 2-phosphosulfolactate phosphatase [Anaerolineae bacterium]|nr:2-phosphosulfolactate phosphatase [Anaerolineae bacterium]
MIGQDLHGRTLIQRTGAGTQGLVRSVRTETVLATSFVTAGATVRYIQAQDPAEVTLVATDQRGEDQLCVDYLYRLLAGETVDAAATLQQVRVLGEQVVAAWRGRVPEEQLDNFAADLTCCLDLDRFTFTVVGKRQDSLWILKPSIEVI